LTATPALKGFPQESTSSPDLLPSAATAGTSITTPNGHDPDTKDYISLFLVLEEPASGSTAKELKAQHRFRFVGEVPEKEELPPALLAAEEVSNHGSHRGWGNARFVRREDLEKSEHLKNDSFAVRCDIIVISEFRAEDETATFVSVPRPDLHRHLGDLLQTRNGADVVFVVSGETFSAHMCVLAPRGSLAGLHCTVLWRDEGEQKRQCRPH
jgi:speckle-type POZ protein